MKKFKNSGLVHLVNAGEATRQEYVAEILRLAGRKTRVEGVDSGSFPRLAPVPDDERLQSQQIEPPRAWQKALKTYLKEQTISMKAR